MRQDIEVMFEGGTGLSLASVDQETADSLMKAYRNVLGGQNLPFAEVQIQQEDGAHTTFVIDLKRILTMSCTTSME